MNRFESYKPLSTPSGMENMPDNINYCNNRKDFYLDNAGNLCRNEKHPEKDPDQSTELNTKCQKKKTKKTL